MTTPLQKNSNSKRNLTLIFIGIMLIAVNMRAPFNAVGPLVPAIKESLHLSNSAMGILTAMPLLCFALFSPIASPISKKVGSERTIFISLAILTLGILLRSFPLPGGIWIGTVLIGFAIALSNVLLPGIVKKNFPDKVTNVSGSYAATQSIFAALFAGAVVPIAGQNPEGWRLALGICAGFSLLATIVAVPLLNKTTVPDKTSTGDDEPAAINPWKNYLAWMIAFYFGTQSMAFYAIVSWMPTLLKDNGISAATAGIWLTILMLTGFVANLVTPPIMNRMKDLTLLAVANAALMALAWIGLYFLPHLGLLWAIIGGFSGGSGLIVLLSSFSLRTKTHTNSAALSGMAQSIGYLLAALGPILVGALKDMTGSWTVPVVFIVITTLLQAYFGFIANKKRYVEDF